MEKQQAIRPLSTTALTIAIDAMGGDDAPQMVIDGLVRARFRHMDVHFELHGDEAKLQPLLAPHNKLADCTSIHHADVAITMDEKPSQALRQDGRKSSMWMAIKSVRDGTAQAAVSAGNTGALMAMSKVQLRTLPSIDRPALIAMWPTMIGETAVLDMGANIEVNAKQLVDFAVMGSVYSRILTGIQRPKIGLLNVGVEETKGHEEVRAAATLLANAPIKAEFVGFVEGDDIGKGTVDVVVTDGFTGNIALKTAEGTARLISDFLSRAMRRSIFSKIGYLFARGAFQRLKDKMDPRNINGGVFLGLNGVVIKSHGGTDAIGFASAIDVAVDMARENVAEQIADEISRMMDAPLFERSAGNAQADEGLGEAKAALP